MEGVLTDLGKTFAEKLINGTIEKSRYIFCFNCIAKEFDEEKVKLESERITMRQRFKVASEKDRDIQFNAQFWEKQANKFIQEDTKTNQRCFFGFFPDCIWRCKRGEELTTKIVEIKMLMEKGEKLENIELVRHLPDVERYSSQYYISFKSRELKFKELLDALKDDNNYITGLHGMGGTGKTTMAKEVGKQLKVLQQFNHVIDTTVSFTPDIKKIQDDIAGSLGLEWGEINESDRPKKLWSRLTNGEKILVILDDVWGNLDFDYIGIPNSDNHKGCKVLVTTRNLMVCNKVVCGKTIQLELLSEEDAWVMFKMYADLSNISSKPFLNKGRKIASKCKGLPVAVATIATSLKGQKRREEWDVALKSLQKHVSMGGVDDDLVDIYKCLKFSYDYLKDEKAKGLFLLCSTFSEDEEISTEILTRLGIGVGLFGEAYDNYNDARSQAVVAKNKLLDSCLLLETEKGDVKMHDLVREVAQWIANKEILVVNISNKNQKSHVEWEKNIKYLIFEGNLVELFSSRFDGSKLEILTVNMVVSTIIDIPLSFFENISGIRVLNLLGKMADWERPTLSLSQSIRSLMNIRSLLIERSNLGDISVLGSLQSLETLDLNRCDIDELPQEIAKLEKLRLLKFEQCKIRINNPFEVIQRCPSLEELYFSKSFNKFCNDISLPTLQRYRLIEFFNIKSDSTKCVLLFKNYFSEATFKYVMQTAEFLHLTGFKKGWRNIMPEIVPIDHGMNDIIKLYLTFDSQLQCLVDTKHVDSRVPNVFSKLVVLHLEYMKNLEELCNGPISFDSMNNLEELSIKCCPHLRCLFQCSLKLCNLKTMKLASCSTLVSIFEQSTSRSLLLLEKLEISDCNQLENIITHEEIVDGDNDYKSCNSMFPKLKVVNIQSCPQLLFILPLVSAEDLLLLEAITIKHCDKLKYIFGKHQDVKLTSLKEMAIVDSPNFIDIFPESDNSIPSSIKWASNSISKPQTQLEPIKSKIFSWSQLCFNRYEMKGTRSTKIPSVSEDKLQDCSISKESNLNRLHTWEHAQCLSRLSHILCNIKVIVLENLSKIKSVFILSIAPKMLLETLVIKNCDELKHIVIDNGDHDRDGNSWDNVFPKLKEMYIENCEQLKYIFGYINVSDHQNNINEVLHLHLPALECLKLYNLPSLIGICSKNYRATLPPLTVFELVDCSQVDIKSTGDFIVSYSISRSQDSTTIKEFSGNLEHFVALEKLVIKNSKVESIFCLNEVNEQQMKLELLIIKLQDLPVMTRLFSGPRNCFVLQNIIEIIIVQCEKLEIIFSASILRRLPQLHSLIIKECKELKHIFEEDLENKTNSNSLSSRTCFPKLQVLSVVNCNKLKCVFPVSIRKELPELKALMIREADELEEIFKREGGDQKVEIPNLNVVAFVNLPSLFQTQGIHFQAVGNRFVQNCKKFSLTLASTANSNFDIYGIDFGSDLELREDFLNLFKQLQKESKGHNSCSEYSSSKTTEDLADEIEVEAASGHESTSSQGIEISAKILTSSTHLELLSSSSGPIVTFEHNSSLELMNEKSTSPLVETDATVKFSQGIKINIEDGITSNNVKTLASSTHSKSISSSSGSLTTSECETSSLLYGDGQIAIASPPIAITKPLILTTQDVDIENMQKTRNTNDDEVSLNDDVVIKVTSIIPSPQAFQIPSISKGDLSQIDEELENGNDQIATTSFSIATTDTNDQVSRNDHAFKKVSSNIEKQFSKDDGLIVSKSSVSSQFRLIPSKGDLSQKVEDLSAYLLVKSELEQLVSKNHLDYKNMSLLTDFLVKHPFVRLKDTSISNRYKGCAYNLLAELLKFLETHSVLEALGSCHSEFVELLQDARSFGFDNDWLDGVERRALFPDIQVSEDALKKLVNSKEHVTKEVEGLRLKIEIFSQHVEELKHQLTSSETVLESIIQQEAILSAPIGY